MNWERFAICKGCGCHKPAFHNHSNIFKHVCGRCGESSWDTDVVAREVWKGIWWNPLTWLDFELKRKYPDKKG